jgi:hypothetical protein
MSPPSPNAEIEEDDDGEQNLLTITTTTLKSKLKTSFRGAQVSENDKAPSKVNTSSGEGVGTLNVSAAIGSPMSPGGLVTATDSTPDVERSLLKHASSKSNRLPSLGGSRAPSFNQNTRMAQVSMQNRFQRTTFDNISIIQFLPSQNTTCHQLTNSLK